MSSLSEGGRPQMGNKIQQPNRISPFGEETSNYGPRAELINNSSIISSNLFSNSSFIFPQDQFVIEVDKK